MICFVNASIHSMSLSLPCNPRNCRTKLSASKSPSVCSIITLRRMIHRSVSPQLSLALVYSGPTLRDLNQITSYGVCQSRVVWLSETAGIASFFVVVGVVNRIWLVSKQRWRCCCVLPSYLLRKSFEIHRRMSCGTCSPRYIPAPCTAVCL
jgi:hypothetical protein